MSDRLNFFDDVRTAVEPRVNGTLRQLLTGYPWPVSAVAAPELAAPKLRECKYGDAGGATNSTAATKSPGAAGAAGANGAPAAPASRPSGTSGAEPVIRGTVYIAKSFDKR